MSDQNSTEKKPMLLEHVSCDFCGCNQYKLRYRKPDNWLWLNQYEFCVVECIKCSLVYLNPRPTLESMGNYYPEDYHDNRDTEYHQKRYAIQTEFLPVLTNEQVLDVGCAKGDFLISLKKKYLGIQTFGIDFYSENVNSDEIFFHKKLLTDCDFEPNQFDLITAWAVFEHLHQPGKYFEKVHEFLKKQGKFIFLVTNSESLYGKRAYIEDLPRHTYHFSEKSLQNYADKYGFKFSKCYYDDRIYDGRGNGTFHFSLQEFFGLTWEKRFFRKSNFIQRLAGRIGSKLDRIVFRNHWEAKRKKSGIIIVEFTKL